MTTGERPRRWRLWQATITQQLILGFSLILFCMIATLGADVAASLQQNAVTERMVFRLYPARKAAHQMITLARAIDDDGARYLMANNPQQAAQLLSSYNQEVDALRTTLAQTLTLADTAEQRQAVIDFQTFFFVPGGYYDTNQYAFSQLQAGQVQAAYATYFGSPFASSLEQDTETYVNSSEQEIAQATAQEHMAALLVTIFSIGCGIIATLFATGIAILLTRSIRRLYLEIEKKNQALIAASARLEALATTDPLTGLPNHRTSIDRIDTELSQCNQTQEQTALLFIDIDHFKNINDTWGHQIGDRALRHVARTLSGVLRTEDFFGRYGGEEFVVLLTHKTFDEARIIAERLRMTLVGTSCSLPELDNSADISITASIGGAIYPLHGQNSTALIEAADAAMYHVKRTGRNRVCFSGEESMKEGVCWSPTMEMRSEPLRPDINQSQLLQNIVDEKRDKEKKHAETSS